MAKRKTAGRAKLGPFGSGCNRLNPCLTVARLRHRRPGVEGCTSSRSGRMAIDILLVHAECNPAESGYFRSYWRTTGA
jgi:hypothetical protein